MVVLAVLLSLLQSSVGYSDDFIAIVQTIICFVLYAYLVYNESWRIGQHDHNQVIYEHSKYDPIKPLKASVGSQIVGIVLAIWIQVFPHSQNALKFANFFYANFRFPIKYFTERGFNLIYLVPWVFAVALAFLGYKIGYKQKHLIDSVVYSKGSAQRPDSSDSRLK
jgi:RsiW-degrading membrane proteinase PrsW (M82 family)